MVTKAGTIIYDFDWYHTLLVLNYHSGLWGFPKGIIDIGESEHQAAIRETYEETGVKLDFGSLGIR